VRIYNHVLRRLILVSFIMLYYGWTLNAQQHTDEHNTSIAVEQNLHEENVGDHHEIDDDEEFNATEVIMNHVKDSHDWHILTTKKGHHVSVPLPIILISKHSGFHVFMSGKLAHGHSFNGFELGSGNLEVENKAGELVEMAVDGKIIELDSHGKLVEEGFPLDFSITKNVFMMLLAVIILLIVFLSLAKSYKKGDIQAPKGLQGFLEPLVVFVEEDIAIPNIGKEKYAKFMPYLLTVFFFILIHNLMGLIPFFPFGANVTGNIAVTLVLATFTLLLTNLNGNKAYWGHIFLPPGVPFWLLPIMWPVELLGIITKPFALMIRLFANITAGHIIVLSLVSLIFFFKSYAMAVPSLVLVIFMDMIELLVAFLQAYIFTLLSALFIGLAMPEHHHE
jgi:F-type H+-transporting ATPase subunit a